MGSLVVVWSQPPVPQLVHQQAAQPGHMLPGLLPLLPLSSECSLGPPPRTLTPNFPNPNHQHYNALTLPLHPDPLPLSAPTTAIMVSEKTSTVSNLRPVGHIAIFKLGLRWAFREPNATDKWSYASKTMFCWFIVGLFMNRSREDDYRPQIASHFYSLWDKQQLNYNNYNIDQYNR